MTNTIPNVPRELLADLLCDDHDRRIMAERHLLAMLANAPSPAGVDGLEVRAYERKWSSDNIKPEKMVNENGRKEWPFKFKLIPVTQMPCLPDDEPLCRLTDAQAIIDGLRGEVAKINSDRLACRAEFKVMTRACLDTEKERDQQAKRIGELEGLLREARDTYRAAIHWEDLRGTMKRIDAALSAGKEGSDG